MKKILLLFLFWQSLVFAQKNNELLVLSAVVKDKVIPNAQIIFQKNGETSETTSTDASGKATIPPQFIDANNEITLIIKKDGYSTLVTKGPFGGLTYALSPIMEDLDGMRIVLSWGKYPSDLDSHLSYPNNHICYYHQEGTNANLDVDDTDSFGPETITIEKRAQNQKYIYAVHDFSDRTEIDNQTLSNRSNAKVYVYIGNTLIKSYEVPKQKKGTVWVVFMIDESGNIIDINNFENSTSWEGVKSLLSNYRYSSTPSTSITESDKQRALDINKQGENYYHASRIELAVNYYQQALEYNPFDGQIYSNLGLAFSKIGRHAEAIWANREAIKFANDNTIKASSYYNIAKIYENSGQYSDALYYYGLAKENKENPVYDKALLRVKAKMR
ncbi:tetratricopeptide (TPR) repeat protein [Chryseobacterium sp. SORGH_AS 447]|uniref:tetratricopeptide repeat protein n=1 Tax=Chryseobacterium sp. SORGH_AS_0447 TaxID=3041769 RepID=UPI002782DCDF|nr:tetratricopeptide repeat protein [Chryseobacterium sp. SORGH_AS_0447]MDQ1160496.1 tetratricopeptide (TPR) repeat protein [Chryseobacterium sp. SORGH_AS_0447]